MTPHDIRRVICVWDFLKTQGDEHVRLLPIGNIQEEGAIETYAISTNFDSKMVPTPTAEIEQRCLYRVVAVEYEDYATFRPISCSGDWVFLYSTHWQPIGFRIKFAATVVIPVY